MSRFGSGVPKLGPVFSGPGPNRQPRSCNEGQGAPVAVIAAPAVPAEPQWCSGHYEPSAREAFHQHSFGPLWGSFDERLRLGLTRFDSDGRTGDARVEIQYLAEVTEVQGSVSLTDDEASEMLGHIIHALAVKKSPEPGWVGLFFTCAYEAGKAFAAAVRYSRTASPRTASSQSRSIRSM
jgi:hypothetical protein